jgi:hypothetical protein
MNNALPSIFSFVGCPILGTIGDSTLINYGEVCEVCGKETPIQIDFLEYAFDVWEGADIVTTYDRYAVTDRLRAILERAKLKGFQFRDMKVSKSDIFKEADPHDDVKLPKFWELIIIGKALAGHSGWWDYEGICKGCNRPIWKYTERLNEALSSVLKGEIGPPREVRKESWKADDIFRLDDPGPPVVTKGFTDLLDQAKVAGVVFHPAKWV